MYLRFIAGYFQRLYNNKLQYENFLCLELSQRADGKYQISQDFRFWVPALKPESSALEAAMVHIGS